MKKSITLKGRVLTCGIKCDAEGIEVVEKKIWISSCGLVLGTSMEGDPMSPYDVPCRSTDAELAATPIQTEPSP
jgi:hypothetical protein